MMYSIEHIEHYFDTQIEFCETKVSKPTRTGDKDYTVELDLLRQHRQRLTIYLKEQKDVGLLTAHNPKLEVVPVSYEYLKGYNKGVTDAISIKKG